MSPRKIYFINAGFSCRVNKRNHETIFEFVDTVRNLAQQIEVTDKNDSDIWVLSVIISGLKDRKLAERLQLMEKLTLQAAVSFLISSETVKRQDNAIHESDREEIAVEHVRKGRGGRATYHSRGGSREERRSGQYSITLG